MPPDGWQDWVLENYTPVIAHSHPHQSVSNNQHSDTHSTKTSIVITTPNSLWLTGCDRDSGSSNSKDASGKITSVTPGRVTIRQTYSDFTGTTCPTATSWPRKMRDDATCSRRAGSEIPGRMSSSHSRPPLRGEDNGYCFRLRDIAWWVVSRQGLLASSTPGALARTRISIFAASAC